DNDQPFPDNWIYLHDPGTLAGRVQNFSAWSPDMVKPGTTCLGVEYCCCEDDEIWHMSDRDAVRLATDELARIGLVDPADVVDGVKVRVPKAYPMYDPHYREAVAVIHGYLAGFENLKTFGRNGLHRYNNQDHSMWTAILATLNLLDGTNHDVWAVNTEAEYHEEGRIVDELLDRTRELYRDGFWEPEVNRALRAEGVRLWHDPDVVVYQGRSAGFGSFFRQRLEHGRAYGRQRGVRFGAGRNAAGVALACVV